MPFVSSLPASLSLSSLPHPLAFSLPRSGLEWLVIGFVALLIFGKRLPGMARGIGQGILEFKKGIKGAEAEAEQDRPRFDSQTGKPLENAESHKAA